MHDHTDTHTGGSLQYMRASKELCVPEGLHSVYFGPADAGLSLFDFGGS